MSTIYELTQEFLVLLEMLEDADCDIDAVRDTLESINMEIEDKADAYAKIIIELDAKSEALKNQIDRLTNRKRHIENNIDFLKHNLQDAMQATGKTKFKTDLFSFGIQKNPPSLCLDELMDIPEKYLIEQPPKIDRKAMLEDLKNGEIINGAKIEQRESLRIK